MSKRKFINHNDFANWYFISHLDSDGLITTSTAAALLGVKMPYIYQLWQEGRIRKYTYKRPQKQKEDTYYSLSDIMKIVQIKEEALIMTTKDEDTYLNIDKYPKERWDWYKECYSKEEIEAKYEQWKKEHPQEAKELEIEANRKSKLIGFDKIFKKKGKK